VAGRTRRRGLRSPGPRLGLAPGEVFAESRGQPIRQGGLRWRGRGGRLIFHAVSLRWIGRPRRRLPARDRL